MFFSRVFAYLALLLSKYPVLSLLLCSPACLPVGHSLDLSPTSPSFSQLISFVFSYPAFPCPAVQLMKSVGAKNELTYAQFSQILDKLDAEAEVNLADEDEGEGEDDELTEEELEEYRKAAFDSIKSKKTGTASAKDFAEFLEENEEGLDAEEVKEVCELP